MKRSGDGSSSYGKKKKKRSQQIISQKNKYRIECYQSFQGSENPPKANDKIHNNLFTKIF